MAGNTIEVTTDNFKEAVLDSDVPVLVDFWATWCGPCRAIAPMLDQAAGDYAGEAVIAKVNVDQNRPLAMEYNVRSIPALLVFKGGAVVNQAVGAINRAKLDELLKV
jgi:thioredoxin 1